VIVSHDLASEDMGHTGSFFIALTYFFDALLVSVLG
jgi:hypothetical protein